MPITIRVGNKANRKLVTLEMDVRKSLSGDLMIFDHGDIDIVLSTSNNKIIVFPKEVLNDYVYGAQNRLFTFLKKRGVVIPESIRAGSFYGSFEATMQTPINEQTSAAKITLVNISEFINDERPYFEAMETYIADVESDYTDPDKEKSTELGDVPQSSEKGSMRYIRDASAHYLYTM
jgi:hypothetical protein|tara:strand:- start:4550 stop:5080 length:531 start_codon:yes stop_codon:yes gene_type:complete